MVVGLVGEVIVAVPALPAPTVHVPVPVAAIVAVPVLKQATAWSEPALGVVQVPGTVVPTVVLPLRHPFAERTLAMIVWAGPVWLYVGKDELHVAPPSVLNCNVPPLPLTVQFVHVLFTIASVPVGADGVVQVPGTVVPTRVVLLLQPFADSTLA